MHPERSKKIIYGTLVFALLGALLSSYVGPKIIAWYFDPPVNIGVNCRSAVEWSMSKLQITQFWGLICGLILGVVIMSLATSTKSAKPETT